MENTPLRRTSPYAGCCIILTTKHAKSIAAAPPFWDRLAAGMLEYTTDTDLPGTLTGEAERGDSVYDCARRKCKMGLDISGVDYALASAGRFGFHPLIPFMPCYQEVLHFMDRKRGFQLSVSHVGEKTNYQMQVVEALEELEEFAAQAKFPSHALIARPNDPKYPTDATVIFEGITTQNELKTAVKESLRYSRDRRAWVQTDMRAHMNPSRMAVIQEVADTLAQRLATTCPACGAPGWGSVRAERGLFCESCAEPTQKVVSEIFGCVLCQHVEAVPRPKRLLAAP